MNTHNTHHEDELDSLPFDSENTPLPFREKLMFESIYPKIKKANIREITKGEILKEKDMKTIETFVHEIPKERTKLWMGFKDVVIATFLFCIFQFPFVDNLINKMFKTESAGYRIFIKSVIFALFFFMLSNISLSSRY